MKLVAFALALCPLAFSQTAPEIHLLDHPNLVRDLLTHRLNVQPSAVFHIAPKPAPCAIPLAQALPSRGRTDYRIRVMKPHLAAAQLAAETPKVGADACRQDIPK
jgi:hypothetical protein